MKFRTFSAFLLLVMSSANAFADRAGTGSASSPDPTIASDSRQEVDCVSDDIVEGDQHIRYKLRFTMIRQLLPKVEGDLIVSKQSAYIAEGRILHYETVGDSLGGANRIQGNFDGGSFQVENASDADAMFSLGGRLPVIEFRSQGLAEQNPYSTSVLMSPLEIRFGQCSLSK